MWFTLIVIYFTAHCATLGDILYPTDSLDADFTWRQWAHKIGFRIGHAERAAIVDCNQV